MSAVKKTLILRAYRSGLSGHTIARKYNVPVSTVYYMLKKSRVQCRTQSESLTLWWFKRSNNNKKKSALKMLQSGMRTKDVAIALSVSSSTISRWSK